MEMQEASVGWWVDGFDGQEDELEDVKKGKLDAPTDDEPEKEIVETNKVDPGSKSEDDLASAQRRAGLRPM